MDRCFRSSKTSYFHCHHQERVKQQSEKRATSKNSKIISSNKHKVNHKINPNTALTFSEANSSKIALSGKLSNRPSEAVNMISPNSRPNVEVSASSALKLLIN